jgi:hypothetical protein
LTIISPTPDLSRIPTTCITAGTSFFEQGHSNTGAASMGCPKVIGMRPVCQGKSWFGRELRSAFGIKIPGKQTC